MARECAGDRHVIACVVCVAWCAKHLPAGRKRRVEVTETRILGLWDGRACRGGEVINHFCLLPGLLWRFLLALLQSVALGPISESYFDALRVLGGKTPPGSSGGGALWFGGVLGTVVILAVFYRLLPVVVLLKVKVDFVPSAKRSQFL